MHASRRQAEGSPDDAVPRDTGCGKERERERESEEYGAGDLGLRQESSELHRTSTRIEKPLRSILKTTRQHDMASSSTSAATARQRNTTESTPIASATQSSRDYASIPPAKDRNLALENSRVNGDATHDSTTNGEESRAPQRIEPPAAHASGRWSEFWEKWGSVELENKGSVARDHLALERTFLAWLRTSLSFASIGIAITQLFRLNSSLQQSSSTSTTSHKDSLHRLRHLGKPLGATFIGISILMLFIGFHRYFEAQHYVIRGKFPASRGSIVLVSGVAGALIVSSLVVILATGPGVFET